MGDSEGCRRSLLVLAMVLCVATAAFPQRPPASQGQNKATGHSKVLKLDGGVPPYKGWLEEDVAWIITDEERAAFRLLTNDEERDQFVDAFWERRDPTPDTYDNEFKDEHYRRIAYANDHFGVRGPGWKSDRGRIYIVYGPPDRIDTYASGQPRPPAQDGGESTFPLESWHYRYLEGVGMDVVVDFVDVCECGDYRMKMPSELKDALLYIPRSEHRDDRLRSPVDPSVYLRTGTAKSTRFKDLKEKLDSKLKGQALTFGVGIAEKKVTDITSLVTITLIFERSEVTLVEKDGAQQATLDVLGRLTTLTGKVAETFEDTLDFDVSKSQATFERTLALHSGRYRVEIAAEDASGHQSGTWVASLKVGGQ